MAKAKKTKRTLVSNIKKKNEFKAPSYQNITANFEGAVRHDSMEGRDYLVAPMVMLLEGVHEGDHGPLLYPADELAKTPFIWNTKPVVVYHPKANGVGVSACDSVVLSNRGVGVIMNTTFDDGKLKAEAWVEVDRANKVDERIMTAIENNETMELSTGLLTENDNIEGEWNGEPYIGTARNYKPDHLALLPDKKGACSIEDGAGFLRLNESKEQVVIDVTCMSDKERKYLLTDKSGVLKTINNAIATLVSNEMSHENTRSLLSSLLRTNDDSLWVDVVFDNFFVYEDDGKLYKQDYDIKDNSVSFVGDKEEVVRITEFRTKSGKFVGNDEGEQMKKKKLVDGLIKNDATQWAEEDRESLMALNEETLSKMSPVENEEDDATAKAEAEAKVKAEADEVEDNAANMSPEKFIETQVPKEMQGMLRNGLKSHKADKARLCKVILANEKNVFTQEQLEGKDITELHSIAKLAAVKPVDGEPTLNYDGLGDPEEITENAEEPMEAPVLSFSK